MLEGMEGVSSFAKDVDLAIWVVIGMSLGIFVIVVGVMFYFLYKYSAKRHRRDQIKNIEHNLVLEIMWTVIPTFLLGVMFYYGYTSLKVMREIPEDNLHVKVTGQMWFWTHEYPNGKVTNDLYVPVGVNIKLDIGAKLNDVLHSYYVPAFRIKQDAVPGKVYSAWFRADKTGSYDVLCAEYCGTRHSYMLSKIHVIDKERFDTWYDSDQKTPFDEPGVLVAQEHPGLAHLEANGCTGCHSLDGSVVVGPSFQGIFGRTFNVEEGGTLKEVLADEAYLKRSILDPDGQIVEGFSGGMMQSYEGVLSDEQIDEIVDYFKHGDTLAQEAPAVDAMDILNSNGCTGCHSLDGSVVVGPSFQGIFGRTLKVEEGGTLKEILADEAYLKRSILDPDGQIVEGFSGGMMQSYEGVLSDEEIQALVEYFKGL
ncbi:MAG: cytochrome c oxidase subunit II [Campylobacterales bacterium]|nr:cytochrome c oxidase subunit II [Campylobacterales bacterium]